MDICQEGSPFLELGRVDFDRSDQGTRQIQSTPVTSIRGTEAFPATHFWQREGKQASSLFQESTLQGCTIDHLEVRRLRGPKLATLECNNCKLWGTFFFRGLGVFSFRANYGHRHHTVRTAKWLVDMNPCAAAIHQACKHGK